MAKGQFEHVLVPVASDTDAESTAEALADHLETDRVTVVHVVEKAGGAPDKAGVEQREEAAAEAFERFEETYGESVETDIVYDTNIADGLLAAAAEVGADALAFTPRGGGWFERLLSGSVTRRLLDETDRPVVVLPGGDQ
ncbi:universal stress protein [Halosegnis rubeus]|jgi:nucleotide-binding universal stress UspA family protein|uniref:Universal stress protein n=1 Tax=Halosegnis rubeus TaxID=2212850 RepID=A0A5N5UL88_9EURY|nr:universal stress protein [Halosegnis rubeus]KAB7515584.1 universal stress protein [Halosegnis rubeus]KAB7519687.1 universal stress protein [Halosegnis rubeus]